VEVELVSAVAEAPVDEEESEDAGELYYVSWARPVILDHDHGRREIKALGRQPSFLVSLL
jgi:hypothetical protein